MPQNTIDKSVYNYIRLSFILIILPGLYLVLWLTISRDQSLTYFEQVQLLMSYFPESMRNPFGITLTFLGMSLISAVFSLYGYLKSITRFGRLISIMIFTVAGLLTFWFGMSLF